MFEPLFDDPIRAVSKHFNVLEVREVSGGYDFLVTPLPGSDLKQEFRLLVEDLDELDMLPKLLRTEQGAYLILVRRVRRPSPLAAWKSLLSLVVSAATVWISGWMLSSSFRDLVTRVDVQFVSELGRSMKLIDPIFFVIPLFAILGVHELGHMMATRWWGGDWEPPIFIPGPPPLGTFGAVIRSAKVPVNRDEVFDMGISGPLSGFIPAVAVTVIGLLTSPVLPSEVAAQLAKEEGLQFVPTPLLFGLIQRGLSVPEGTALIMSPIAFAGWAGLILTFLNLLPAGQLDGGHVIYAIIPSGRARAALGMLAVLVAMIYSPFMALLVALFTFTRHPPPLDEVSSLSTSRKVVGSLVYLAVLLLTAPLPL